MLLVVLVFLFKRDVIDGKWLLRVISLERSGGI